MKQPNKSKPKIQWDEVKICRVRDLLLNGLKQYEIARVFNVHKSRVSQLISDNPEIFKETVDKKV